MKYLQNVSESVEGVIEKLVSPTVYIVRIDADMKIIRLRLDGVDNLQINPKLP